MLCAVQVTVLKYKKSHDKLVKINARKILIYKPNNLAVGDDRVTLALVGWQIVGANGDGDFISRSHNTRIEQFLVYAKGKGRHA